MDVIINHLDPLILDSIYDYVQTKLTFQCLNIEERCDSTGSVLMLLQQGACGMADYLALCTNAYVSTNSGHCGDTHSIARLHDTRVQRPVQNRRHRVMERTVKLRTDAEIAAIDEVLENQREDVVGDLPRIKRRFCFIRFHVA